MKDEAKRIKQLMEVGFPTGSYYLGCNNPRDSDWVVNSSDWDRIIGKNLGNFFCQHHDYNEIEFICFFINHKGILFNFIVMFDIEDFQTWKIATRLIKRIPVRFLQEKSNRVYLFEALKVIVKNKRMNKYKEPRNNQELNWED